MLDAAKVADSLLLLPSVESGVDEFGEHCLSCLFAQGLPSCIVATKVCEHVVVSGRLEKGSLFVEG